MSSDVECQKQDLELVERGLYDAQHQNIMKGYTRDFTWEDVRKMSPSRVTESDRAAASVNAAIAALGRFKNRSREMHGLPVRG